MAVPILYAPVVCTAVCKGRVVRHARAAAHGRSTRPTGLGVTAMGDKTTIQLANETEVKEGSGDTLVWLESSDALYALTQHEAEMLATGDATIEWAHD